MKALVKYRLYIIATLVLLSTRIGLGAFFISASDITEANVLSAVNNERTSRNIPALNTNSKLSAAALSKAQDMITRKYFSHVDPDGHYIWDKIIAYGYTPYTILGENLAIDFSDTEGLISAWIDSPTHRENMLNPSFKDQGMGVAHGDVSQGQYNVAVANTFGAQPASTAVVQKPVQKPATQPTQPAPKPSATPVPVATPKPAVSPAPTPVAVATQPPSAYPEFNTQNLSITPTVNGSNLNLHVYAEVSGNISAVTAAVAGQSINLAPDGSGFSGNISLQKHFDLAQNNLILTATNVQGQTTQATVPLKNYPLPAGENPGSLANLYQQPKNPDMYTVFAYVVIVFGVLFIFFSVIDSFKTMKKTPGSLLSRGSKIIMILILLSTILVVNWWH